MYEISPYSLNLPPASSSDLLLVKQRSAVLPYGRCSLHCCQHLIVGVIHMLGVTI